jgi:hypothetical protein
MPPRNSESSGYVVLAPATGHEQFDQIALWFRGLKCRSAGGSGHPIGGGTNSWNWGARVRRWGVCRLFTHSPPRKQIVWGSGQRRWSERNWDPIFSEFVALISTQAGGTVIQLFGLESCQERDPKHSLATRSTTIRSESGAVVPLAGISAWATSNRLPTAMAAAPYLHSKLTPTALVADDTDLRPRRRRGAQRRGRDG